MFNILKPNKNNQQNLKTNRTVKHTNNYTCLGQQQNQRCSKDTKMDATKIFVWSDTVQGDPGHNHQIHETNTKMIQNRIHLNQSEMLCRGNSNVLGKLGRPADIAI